MPTDFYRNIFKKSFLLKNDIHFPELKIGYDAAFLSNALSKTDNICTLPINLCECYDISDGPLDRVASKVGEALQKLLQTGN